MNGFRFADPAWFLALLAIPAWLAWRRRRPAASAPSLTYPATALLGPAAAVPARRRPAWRLGVLRIISLVLLAFALARPQVEKSETREDARGINLMLALDFSGSMRTRDFVLDGRRVTRSDGLRSVCTEFIRGRPTDRIGLVRFDRDAHLASPLTLDHDWLVERLGHEENSTGTAIGSALAVAAHHLQRHTNETRVIVLMTDAENISAGPPPDAVADAIAPLGIRFHCIQLIGSGGGQAYLRGYDDLSEHLARCTARTGGELFRVRDGSDLRAVYARIDTLEKQKLTDRRQKGWRELFPALAMLALGVAGLEMLLGQFVWRRLP